MSLISKKDLLATTGISYGQLYRWKREGLIPEEWFIKRPAYTGQETFFPREQILSRIQTILEAKETHSLEELSRLLSPERGEVLFPPEELEAMPELDSGVLAAAATLYPKEERDFNQVVLYAALSRAVRELNLSPGDIPALLGRAVSAARNVKEPGELTMTVFLAGGERHVLLSRTAAPLSLDGELEVLGSWDLGALAGKLKLKYQRRHI